MRPLQHAKIGSRSAIESREPRKAEKEETDQRTEAVKKTFAWGQVKLLALLSSQILSTYLKRRTLIPT
jgi:hypothetical protein